ncbi:MAG TPA: flagellar basal-body rod protein FlgF [Steroidobacteraceae bacterium]|jgi:flagellar basal-body rod protein FlgF|nr:flagellar basal-body rod protein FlgF [Steroidobacteraceae bacterium]
MDKLLYVAMSGAKETLRAQAANNHNLANASTTGFKADLSAFQARAVSGPGYASRVYAQDNVVGWDSSVGSQQQTGNALDVSVNGTGYFAVQDSTGNEAYTRAGDLHVDPSGQLLTATGQPVLGDNGPISVPPYSSITVAKDGSISIVPLGSTAQTNAIVARIKLVNPPANTLQRGADGLFHSTSTDPVEADAATTVTPGTLESSNVNIASAMVNMIELARQFDMQIKAVHAADDNAQSATKLLQSTG